MEKKGDTFIQIVTIYYINLSLNLSTLIHDLKRKKYKIKEEEHLHYPTLKDRKPNLNPNLLAFWASAGLYIGKWGFQKTRHGHASQIDAWPHHIAPETGLLPRFRGNTRDLGPWFLASDFRCFQDLLGILSSGYICPDLCLTCQRSRFNASSGSFLAWPPRNPDLITRKWV